MPYASSMATEQPAPWSLQLRQALDRHPVLKAGLKRVLAPVRPGTSGHYEALPDAERGSTVDALKGAWLDASIPGKQREGVEATLAAYRKGMPMRDFDVLVGMLGPIALRTPGASLMEVGCSSGYYADVLAARQIDLAYHGCDFSQAFIELARQYHPELAFSVEDATALSCADASFDVVVSGCCLLHISDYARAIAETARVARSHAVFHRTPVLARHATRYFTKRAYGVRTVEIHFNEAELVALFHQHGLSVIGIETLVTDWRDGDAFAIKTYLCEKKAP